ncbi:MAG: hypothetical protein Q7K54_03280 [Candidatus Parcubacteria bacterium]|nr:hypothetical protein [Candidatus Parcubacteria bacterium]
MSKKREKTIVTFKDGKNNILIASDRITGESKADHNKRIKEIKKIMIEESRELNKNNTEKLLEDVITAISNWKKACIAQGENPVCISHFVHMGPSKNKSPKTRYAIFGEQPEVMNLLAYTNEMLDPNGGDKSLIKTENITKKKSEKKLTTETNDLSRRG